MKTHVCIVRDHSASMRSLSQGAMDDFNLLIEGIKASKVAYHDIFCSVVECGVGYLGRTEVRECGRRIEDMFPLSCYSTDGSCTPLWESVMTAINSVRSTAQSLINKQIVIENEAFIVMVITDGHNNAGLVTASQLAKKIQEFQATDKWTFVFRVPVGNKSTIVGLGIPEGNIIEWEQTSQALQVSTQVNLSATRSYFDSRSSGKTSTNKFYTNMTNVKIGEVKKELDDITTQVRSEAVWTPDNGKQIRDFCENHFGGYEIGKAYYQLMKPEKLQGHKKLIIKHLKSGKYFAGDSARQLLGLPDHEVKIVPGDHFQYEIFVQSTSYNRKLVSGTKILYWD